MKADCLSHVHAVISKNALSCAVAAPPHMPQFSLCVAPEAEERVPGVLFKCLLLHFYISL